MRIPFVKMNGAGNDFIMIDNREAQLTLPAAAIRELCERKRGVGADGVILIEPPTEGDFRMRYYNADGGEAEMCGNGARCAARYASDLGLGEGANGHRQVRFTAQPGLMEAQVGEMTVAVTITAANGFEGNISLELAQGAEIVHFVNTGVPHAVVVVPDVDRMAQAKLEAQGRAIRRHPRFEPDLLLASLAVRRSDLQLALVA